MRHVRDIGCAVVLLLGLAGSVCAQGTGDIVGRVVDPSGAVLPGVTVTAINRATNISCTAVTTETGDYAFTRRPGTTSEANSLCSVTAVTCAS